MTLFIWERSTQKMKDKGLELWSIKLVEYMKVTGQKTKGVGRGMRNTLMEIHMKGNLIMENLMGKEYIGGLTTRAMKESGIKVLSMDMVYGKVSMVIHILENGEIQKLRDMVYIFGRMGIGTKENGEAA